MFVGRTTLVLQKVSENFFISIAVLPLREIRKKKSAHLINQSILLGYWWYQYFIPMVISPVAILEVLCGMEREEAVDIE